MVIDTNVFISGVFFTGPPYQILEAWRNAKIRIVISPDIFEEYRRVGDVLANRFPGIDIDALLRA